MRKCDTCHTDKDDVQFHPATRKKGWRTCVDCTNTGEARTALLAAFAEVQNSRVNDWGRLIHRALAARGFQYCPDCAKALPFSAFTPSLVGARGAKCQSCKREYNAQQYKDKGLEFWREKHRAYTYGVSPEQYDAMVEKQDGACPCCKVELDTLPPNQIHVEHNHRTREVRGITCMRCNFILGYARDEPERLLNAVAYLAQGNVDGPDQRTSDHSDAVQAS